MKPTDAEGGGDSSKFATITTIAVESDEEDAGDRTGAKARRTDDMAGGVFKCEKCNYVFANRMAYKTHLKLVHCLGPED